MPGPFACTYGDAGFTIIGDSGVVFKDTIGSDGMIHIQLPPGTYTITENGVVGVSAGFDVESGQITAIVVTNYVPDATPTPTPAATSTPTPTPEPTPVPGLTCQSVHPELDMLELSSSQVSTMTALHSGSFSNGTLDVDVLNFNGSSFSWRSNINVSCLVIHTAGGGTLVNYQPATTGADNLTSKDTITGVSFCYERQQSNPTPAASLPDTGVSLVSASASASGPTAMAALIIGLTAAMFVGITARGRFARSWYRRSVAASGPWSTQQRQR